MPSKTLRFDDEVLDVLRGMTWSDDGLTGYLPPTQLERNMYLAVNKALTAMGGKWNRKAKGHLFKMDPRPQVVGLLDNGSIVVEKDGFFETPAEVVGMMVDRIVIVPPILEPSAGLGAIADQLPGWQHNVICVEKNDQRCAILRDKGYEVIHSDFLEVQGLAVGTVVMNPPFENGQDIDHVRHAYGLLQSTGYLAAIMSEGPFFRSDKKATAFREWLKKVGGRSEKLPVGSFKTSGTGVNTRLVVIQKQHILDTVISRDEQLHLDMDSLFEDSLH